MRLFTDDLNKAAIAMANIIDQLNDLENKIYSFLDIYDYKEDFFMMAYVARVAILDRIERNNWPLTTPIYIPRGLFKVHKTNILNGLDLTVKKLECLVADDPLVANYVDEILKGKEQFLELDKMVLASDKAKL